MASEHPELTEAIEAHDVAALLRIAMRARVAADRGSYCTCSDPVLTGRDLLCGACLLNNRDQERAAVHWLVDAHDHVPGPLDGLMCARCTMWPESPRHNGEPAIGETGWGEPIHGRPAPQEGADRD